MARIVLAACNAQYIHSNLAVYNLKAFAGSYGDQVLLREYTINQNKDEILRDLYKAQPSVICFSCYIWNISFVEELLGDLGKILPDVSLWTGGPEVSFRPEEFLEKNPCVTGVMTGEGEETFLELTAFYQGEGKGALEAIRGIVFRAGNGQIQRTPARTALNLDCVPFAYEALESSACADSTDLGMNGKRDWDALISNRIIYYESSRGCPFSCSYCLSSVDKRLRFRSLELVQRELQFFLDHRVPQVKFVDRTFNCNHAHAMAIWKYIKEHDNGVTNFHFEIAADLVSEEELSCMEGMRPGLIQLEIGVQSTNPYTIREIRRKMDFERVSYIVRRIHAMGNIHQHLDLIAGLPFEDLESFKRSFQDVYALRPHQLQLGFLKVLRGSYMYEMAEEYGCVYQTKEPYEVLSTRWLSYEDILLLKSVESMVEAYYNSGQFDNTLALLEPYFDTFFSLYERLGAFYEKRQYDVISHSRMRRYEILLEFAQEEGIAPLDKLREKMIFDLYLRENLKKRPEWAPDQKMWDKEIWSFRRKNKISKTAHIEVFADGRMVLFDYDKRSPLTHNAQVQELGRFTEGGLCAQGSVERFT